MRLPAFKLKKKNLRAFFHNVVAILPQRWTRNEEGQLRERQNFLAIRAKGDKLKIVSAAYSIRSELCKCVSYVVTEKTFHLSVMITRNPCKVCVHKAGISSAGKFSLAFISRLGNKNKSIKVNSLPYQTHSEGLLCPDDSRMCTDLHH